MPPRKKKVPLPDGTVAEGTVMPFQSGGEHWNEYLLDDGSVVRMKLVVTEIVRVEGQYDEQGNPGYIVSSTNVTAVTSPDELRRDG
ncbi:MAG: hypothetical protein M3285_03585 [Actinomycetota bacterium]|nr:hypothetical protein [Actinomycetota bacterium]